MQTECPAPKWLALAPRIRILLAGICFSSGGAIIKLCSFPALERVGVRAIIAALTLFLLLPEARRRPNLRMLLLAVPYFGTTSLFVIANTMTSAANATFLQATYPLWVTLLGPFILREQARRSDLGVLVFIAVGMLLFFLAPAIKSATAPDPKLGDLFALAAGLSFGIQLIGYRWLGKSGQSEQYAAIAWGNVISAPCALLLTLALGQELTLGDSQSWVAIVFLGVVQIGLSYALLARALPSVMAVEASLLLMIEPALSPFFGYVIHDETPHLLAIAGGVVILVAVAVGSIASQPKSPTAA